MVGYGASSLGVKLDVENAGARLLVTLVLLRGPRSRLFHRGPRPGEPDLAVELAHEHVAGLANAHRGGSRCSFLLDRFKQRT